MFGNLRHTALSRVGCSGQDQPIALFLLVAQQRGNGAENGTAHRRSHRHAFVSTSIEQFTRVRGGQSSVERFRVTMFRHLTQREIDCGQRNARRVSTVRRAPMQRFGNETAERDETMPRRQTSTNGRLQCFRPIQRFFEHRRVSFTESQQKFMSDRTVRQSIANAVFTHNNDLLNTIFFITFIGILDEHHLLSLFVFVVCLPVEAKTRRDLLQRPPVPSLSLATRVSKMIRVHLVFVRFR